jgi:general secretion pathway protein A
MYLAYYGLKVEPFRLTPDPNFLHLSEPHRTALTVVLEGILYRKGLVMITGPIGTGKTTIVHTALQMLTTVSRQKMPIRSALMFNPTLTREEFMEMMLEDFRISCTSTSKARRLAALHQMLIDMKAQGGTAVLFIDEAHLLSPELLEEIRLLGNADTHQEKLLQIVISGQPELTGLMSRAELSALRQRIAGRAHLRPLTFQELRVYLAERLHLAGLRDASPFTTETLEPLLHYSGGVPRVINLLSDGCLTLGFKRQIRIFRPELIEEVAVSLALIDPAPATEVSRIPETATRGADLVPKSMVDTLIEGMRSSRSIATR